MGRNSVIVVFAVLISTIVVSGQVFQQPANYQQQLYAAESAATNSLEPRLYSGAYPYAQYTQGYGQPVGQNLVERIDEPVQVLPTTVENRAAQTADIVYQFPDTNVNNEVDSTKQIHSYTVQRKVTNQFNHVLRRYLKALNVNTNYVTNVQRVNHPKLTQITNIVTQETHQPKLRIQYSRTDTVNDLGSVSAPLAVQTQEQMRRLPTIILPVQVEKVGYDGQPLVVGVNDVLAVAPVTTRLP